MKTKFGRLISVLVVVSFLSFIILSCSSDDDNPDVSSECIFKPTDFNLTITGEDQNSNNYRVDYELENLKDIPYERNSENCHYYIRFKIRATDGAEYQGSIYVFEMTANGFAAGFKYIDHPSGKIMDPSTLTHEIYAD